MRSTPSLIGPGYPLSLKHQQYYTNKAVYVPAILFNVGVDFERRNLKSTLKFLAVKDKFWNLNKLLN